MKEFAVVLLFTMFVFGIAWLTIFMLTADCKTLKETLPNFYAQNRCLK